MMYYKYLF